ncbi:MAG: type I DNA topoisomerase [Ruminococcaceae bacterium]|nr:type I DNA topoisomerase [Oscillospiraceae bacterium]
MTNLVIVESPAKAKTIKKYLGKNYEVIASMGHVRDLPKTKIGVDIEAGFEPQYINIKGKGDLIKSIVNEAKKCDKIYLATDPDREGEAISWHLAHILGLDLSESNRVTFNEITKSGVKNGMASPRSIDIDLVNAQQARRVLDRIVGYKLSPFLWKKVKRGLSAGRVQSVAVRLVVDREEEIRAFESKEYWTIEAKLSGPNSKKQFIAKYYGKGNKKIEIENKAQADEILKEIENAQFIVTDIKNGTKKRVPAPPFTTSTLQQEASRKLNFQSRKTMSVAQELYEGVNIKGMGAVGLITYMRTDSLRISDEARASANAFIEENFGKDYLAGFKREYKSKRNAQDAHEAIRPSMPQLSPDKVKADLTTDQYKLYKLIWERFISCLMADEILDTVSVEINANKNTFKASGYSVKFDGFTRLYQESKDEEAEKASILPVLSEKDILKTHGLSANQHFTQPPARYTEATLIKTLEENGIGRPSTYAPTITTILQRLYVERQAKFLKPTALGEITTSLMKEHFSDIVDAEFTANMEKELDDVEEGKMLWNDILSRFYSDFSKELQTAEKAMEGERVVVPDEETDVVCELCGRNMVIKNGRFGKFLACPGYPECKNTKKIVDETPGKCPECGSKLIGRKGKSGKKFYGCSSYPNCKFVAWDEPVSDVCPQCGNTMFKKKGKQAVIYCAKDGCGYSKAVSSKKSN